MAIKDSFNNIVNSTVHVNLPREHIVPTQLSSLLGNNTLIGREKELQEIDTLLNDSNTLLIKGIGGVGKSSISSYYLHLHKEDYDYYGFFEGLEGFVSELKSLFDIKSEKEEDVFLDILSKLREPKKLEGDKLLVFDDVKDIEENEYKIKRILALKDSGYKIIFTSREDIESMPQYTLDILSVEDAKKLFNSIYEVEDELLLEEVLAYLDYHAFFIEKTAKVLKNNRKVTIRNLKDKFKNGELTEISVKRKKTFNSYLDELFTFEKLDKEEVSILKQFSLLSSIEIEFEFLEKLLNKQEDNDFEQILNYLSEKGWLTKTGDSFKMHQIIKEYIFKFYTPDIKNINNMGIYFNNIIKNNMISYHYLNDENIIVHFDAYWKAIIILDILNNITLEFGKSIANIYYRSSRTYKALPIYLRLISEEENESLESSILALYYNQLANIYKEIGDGNNALILYQKSLEIREKLLDSNHIELLQGYSDFALFYFKRNKYDLSLTLLTKALNISLNNYGLIHNSTANIYSKIGVIYLKNGILETALTFIQKSLDIREELNTCSYNDIAEDYNNLALIKSYEGKYIESYGLFKKAVDYAKLMFGENHSIVAQMYHSLASISIQMKKYLEASMYNEKSLNIRQKLFSENYIGLAENYTTSGELNKFKEEYEEALFFYNKGLKIYINEYGEQHSSTANSYNLLGVCYEQEGKNKIALSSYLKSLEIRKELYKNGHSSIAESYNNIAVYFTRKANYKEAYTYIQKAINMWEKTVPFNHPNFQGSRDVLLFVEKKLSQKKPTLIKSKIARNSPCPCSSGLKYKKCCGKN